MAKVTSVLVARVRDGQTDEVLKIYGRVKKAAERLGAKARVLQQMYGPYPQAISFVSEFDSWPAYAAYVEKVDKDSEFQAILADARAHPRTDIISRSVSNEVDV